MSFWCNLMPTSIEIGTRSFAPALPIRSGTSCAESVAFTLPGCQNYKSPQHQHAQIAQTFESILEPCLHQHGKGRISATLLIHRFWRSAPQGGVLGVLGQNLLGLQQKQEVPDYPNGQHVGPTCASVSFVNWKLC
jgi:hypothetical protein